MRQVSVCRQALLLKITSAGESQRCTAGRPSVPLPIYHLSFYQRTLAHHDTLSPPEL